MPKLDTIVYPPKGAVEVALGMSNFDHSIDPGFAEAIADGQHVGRHAGWDFNALVWAAGGGYTGCVYVYQLPRASYCAATLEALMQEHNAEFGGG